jgi:hypothetical protein
VTVGVDADTVGMSLYGGWLVTLRPVSVLVSCCLVVLLSCVVLCCLVLSCVVLCCLVLSCVVLCCLVLSCVVLCCLVLSCAVLCCLVLSCAVLCVQVFKCLEHPCLDAWRAGRIAH